MTRRSWWLLAAASTACSSRPKAAPQLLPRTVAGAWHLKELKDVPAPENPAVRRVVNGMYDGPGSVSVDVYEMNSSAGGLDMVQKWRPAANTVVFYKDKYFAAVKWEQADRKALQDFVRSLEKSLGEIK